MKKVLIIGALVLIGYLIFRAIRKQRPDVADGGSALSPSPKGKEWSDGLLQKGDSGPDVSRLQTFLNRPPVAPSNYLAVDGAFGAKTESALYARTGKKKLTHAEFAALVV